MASDDIVGLGTRLPSVINAPFDRIWSVMVDKIYHTSNYLPVTNVKTQDRAPNHVFRDMVFNGEVFLHDIYLDKDKGEIRFEVVDKDEVQVNKFSKNTNEIEYYLENKKRKRIPWNIPKETVLKAMAITKERTEQDQ